MHTRDGVAVTLAGLAVLALALGSVGFVRGSLQQDLSAYVVAGRAVGGGLDPYVNHARPEAGLWDGVAVYRHSRFLYPPLAAQLARPAAAVPYVVSKALHAVLSLAALILTLVWWARRGAGPHWRRAAALGIASSALFAPVWAHLERGQVDVFVALAVAPALMGGALWAGVPLALAIFIKPAVGLVLVPLVMLRRWRLSTVAAATVAVLVAIDLAVSGPALVARYVVDVLPRIASFGEGGPAAWLLPPDRLTPLIPVLDSGLVAIEGARYLESMLGFSLSASLPRWLAPDAPASWAFLLPSVAAVVSLAVVAVRMGRDRASPEAQRWLLAGTLPLSVVVSPTGWAMGLVMALPLVSLSIVACGVSPRGEHPGVARDGGLALVGAGLVVCALPGWLPGGFVLGPLIAGAGAMVTAIQRAAPPPVMAAPPASAGLAVRDEVR